MDELSNRPTKQRKLNTGQALPPSIRSNTPQSGTEEQLGAEQTPQLLRANQDKDEENPSSKTTPTVLAISKSQLKKLRKKQEWEAGREERKIKRREKDKEKKTRKAAEREEAALANPLPEPQSEQRRAIHQRPIQVPITLMLDCGFDELMTDKEIMSLSSQLTRCYSDNKGARYRSHLVVSSFGGNLQARFEEILASSHRSWRAVEFTDQDFVAAAQEAHTFMYGPDGGMIIGALNQESRDALSMVGQDRESDSASQVVNGLGNGLGNGSTTIVADRDNVEEHKENDQVKSTVSTTDDTPTSEASKPPIAPIANASPPPIPSESVATSHHSSANASVSHASHASSASIVYLTSDSPHTLTELSPHTTYVIGGLVDKNRHKGICYKRARARNVATAKLPIGEYMTMQSRTVLATNHVVEIMLKWLECGDWGEAFLRVIPKRKEARLKVRKGTAGAVAGEARDRQDEDGGASGHETHAGNGVGEDDGDAGEDGNYGDGDVDADIETEADVEQTKEEEQGGQKSLAVKDKIEAINDIREVLDIEHTSTP